jgi:hypothetical protein
VGRYQGAGIAKSQILNMIAKGLSRHGGKRKGAGRPLDSKNKVSRQNREHLAKPAKCHTEEAIAVVVQIMPDPHEPAAVRITCASGSDRGWGRPPVSVQHSDPNGRGLMGPTINLRQPVTIDQVSGTPSIDAEPVEPEAPDKSRLQSQRERLVRRLSAPGFSVSRLATCPHRWPAPAELEP